MSFHLISFIFYNRVIQSNAVMEKWTRVERGIANTLSVYCFVFVFLQLHMYKRN